MEFLSLSRRSSSARNVHSGEERGEMDVFAGYESVDYFRTSEHFNGRKKKLISKTLMVRLTGLGVQPRPQGFSLKKWVGREKALASAGHVYSLNIPEKLIYMQPAGFALAEGSNNGKQ